MASKPKVLVTGATGFIGGHIVSRLAPQYDVYALERYVTGRYVLGQPRPVKTVFADLRDFAAVRNALRDATPDYIIHLAAVSPVAYSYDHPQEVIDANFLGTVNLAESALRECPNLRQFLFASTSEVYGNSNEVRREDTPAYPNSPYAVAKLACEKYLSYLNDAYSFPATMLRPFNSYGRTSNHHFIVERTIVQMLEGGPVRLGDPSPVRDMLYVDDHVNAYLTCLENKKAVGEIFNFCTGRPATIGELVSIIAKIVGYTGEIEWDSVPKRPLDIQYLVGDNGKAKTVLGWEPRFTLEAGLKRTVDAWRKEIPKKP